MTLRLLPAYIIILLLSSCVDVEEFADTPQGNTEALWRIMDEHYCFFSEKKEQLGVDWNEIHSSFTYQASHSQTLSKAQLFEFLGNMIGTLRDGHVNLYASFDYARNWSWKEDYPANFSDALQRRYLGTDYRIAGGIIYRILDDNTGYMYIESFENELGEGNIEQVLYYLAPCRRLIIDIRNNGGGMLTQAEKLAAHFCSSPTLVGYMCHKTGPGHDDFSTPQEQWIKPSAAIRWNKPVSLLTNRSVFSAANEFVKYMKCMPHVTVIGDHTGGGSGMPYTYELPNGWGVRLSACPMFDVSRQSTENGIEPDIRIDINEEDLARGIDTILETARKL